MAPEGDYNSRGAADNLLTGLQQYPEKALNTALLIFGSGDGGGGPGEIHHEVTGASTTCAVFRGSSTDGRDFFRALEKRPIDCTRHAGELHLETHQGTYTTQAAIKNTQPPSRAPVARGRGPGRDRRASTPEPTLEPIWRDRC